jgi:signal transduction histidine kinase
VRETAARVAAQWDIRVNLDTQRPIPPVPHRTAHEVTRMVQESLVNAVRHGAASAIDLTFAADERDLKLTIAYEGRGFDGFSGRQDLASLKEMRAGPRTLKERVAGLNGSLVIDSSENRVQVEIAVPITPSPRC